MGRERQKAKKRSSVSKARPKTPGRTKSGKKKVNFVGNPILAKKWDKKLSLSQNYARLGLTSKLNAPTGGLEKKPLSDSGRPTVKPDPLAIIQSSALKAAQKPQTTKVERDHATGKILRVITLESQDNDSGEEANVTAANIRKVRRPLNDPLDSSTTIESKPQPTSVGTIISELEAETTRQESAVSRRKRPQRQSEREQTWLARLMVRHGDNISAMFMDRQLNPMQNTERDIKKRLAVFKKNGGREKIQDILDDG